MRCIGLIMAASLVAACGGPGTEAASNTAAESQEEVVMEKGIAPNALVEPDPAATVTNDAAHAQGQSVSACLMQGSDRLHVAPLRAVGTEPFWGAHVEGRCVTYSNPDDPQGVRVWTRYSEDGDKRSEWVGQLGGKKFEMRVRPEAGCSDGMSDKIYPMEAELLVNGEHLKGCAEPL